MTAATYVSKAATLSPSFMVSTFLRMVSSLPFSFAVVAHSAISVFVLLSFHSPSSAKSSANFSKRFASEAASASPCISTLTAKSAAFPSPFSKIFKFSNS